MAVAAKFVADFSNFSTELARAETKVKEFSSGVGRVDKDLQKFGDLFSGRKIIQDATLAAKAIEDIGGTSKLTTRELERVSAMAKEAADKLRAMGGDVPPRMQALADAVKKPSSALETLGTMARSAAGVIGLSFTAGAVINAIRSTGEWAGRIDDLSKKMGISREAVQRFDFAAKQNGSTVDAIGSAMAQMGKRLVEGDSSTVGALGRLNLRIEDLQRLQPDQAFKRIASAINDLPNPMEKSAAAMALMGRAGADLIPTFDSLESDMSRAVVASDAMIAAGDKLGDSWDSLKSAGTGLLAGVLIPFAPALEAAASGAARFAQAQLDLAEATRRVAEEAAKHPVSSMAGSGPNLGAIQDQLNAIDMERSTKKAQEAVQSLAVNGFKPLTMSMSEAEGIAKKLDAEVKKHIETVTKVDTVQQNWLKSSRELTTALYDLATGMTPVIDASGHLASSWAAMKPPVAFAEGEGVLRELFNPALDETTIALQQLAYGLEYSVDAAGNWVTTFRDMVPVVTEQIAGPIATLSQRIGSDLTSGLKGAFESVGPTIVGAIMGGGNALKAVGSQFGLKLTQSLFGPESGLAGKITSMFGQTLGGAFNALLPGLGALLGPLLGKIGSFFKHLFGGPSEEELAGRGVAAAFRDQVSSMLTEQQRLEAGNDEWKKSVIAVRDAYIKAGHTEAEALAAMDRLWRAEKEGPEEVQRVIDEINRTMAVDTPAAVQIAGEAAIATVETVSSATQQAVDTMIGRAKQATLDMLGLSWAGTGNSGGGGGNGSPGSGANNVTLMDFLKANGVQDLNRFSDAVTNLNAWGENITDSSMLEQERNKAANEAANFRVDHPELFLSRGGVVPQYFARGGWARGTDTVPAMLTPGEGVVSVQGMRALASGRSDQWEAVLARLQALDSTLARLPLLLRDASMTRVAVRA